MGRTDSVLCASLRLAVVVGSIVPATPAAPPGVPDTWEAGFEDGFDQGAAAATATPSGGPQTVVYYVGYQNRTCYRVPVLLAVGGTLFAFAESRHGAACFNDDSIPLQPKLGDNRTAVVLRTSSDRGKTWSSMIDLCKNGVGGNGCADYEAIYDSVRKRLVVQYASADPTIEDNTTNRLEWPAHHIYQTASSDLGQTWSAPLPMASALASVEAEKVCAPDCDLLVGPGRGLQLDSKRKDGKAGRLLFCGHRTDAVTNRISPIWSSDDGEGYTLRAVLPQRAKYGKHGEQHGTNATLDFGPDECQMAELANGDILYNARNNWVRDTWRRGIDPLPWNRSQHRMVTRSTDGGDTWAELSFDTTLSDHSHGCQASLLSHPSPSDTVYFSQPLTPSRHTMTVHRSEDGGRTWPHFTVVATGGASYSCMSSMPPPPADDEINHDDDGGDDGDEQIGLLYERDGPLCTSLNSSTPTVACNIAFTTFPAKF